MDEELSYQQLIFEKNINLFYLFIYLQKKCILFLKIFLIYHGLVELAVIINSSLNHK